MKFLPSFLLTALAISPLLSGCASSPKGGATATPSNRLSVTLTIDKTINANYYYGVAFDDVLDDGTGPRALDSGGDTPVQQVMGGNWRLFVLFHQNLTNPTIYYRSDPAEPGTTQTLLGTSILFTSPRVSATSINFILNLDAKLNGADYIFSHTAGATPVLGVDRFETNFVATNTAFQDNGNNSIIKPVDAYESQTISVPFELLINSTRSGQIVDPQGDKRPNIDSQYADVNFGQIDVRQFDFSVTRTDGSGN